MTRAIRSTAYNELRTLSPLWAAAAAMLALAGLTDNGSIEGMAVSAYALGSVVIGAQVMGHEYSSRTLTLLLSQPISRHAIFAVKLFVAGGMVLTLTAVASQTIFQADRGDPDVPVQAALLVALASVSLAPALTLLCRSAIGGVVFTIGIPGVVYTSAMVIALLRFGTRNASAIDEFAQGMFWPVTSGICAVAGLASWWMFGRLQAIDGAGADIHLPQWLSRSASTRRRRHPMAELVAKELHIHQMAFVLAALYLAGAAIFAVMHWWNPEMSTDPAMAITVLYLGSLPVVIGSLASAEERHMGTAQWQLLMPMAAWKQWAVKTGVAIGLALLLALALPWAASVGFGPPRLKAAGELWAVIAAAVFVLASGSLYVSSLSGSGLRALVIAVPALFGGFLFLQWSQHYVYLLLDYSRLLSPPRRFQWYMMPGFFMTFVTLPLSCALLIAAYRNERAGVRSIARVGVQLVIFAAITLGMSAVMFIAGRW